ncbi:bifunctional phosphoribosylaminoimidazolecarboxamide formyltransferase/IMP cyclohydrolase [Aciduricibacillus chroicocephali]|uniref:Bifunctional purine biosynthesis protein PurH n=1 Tax=Aciduricibacillus chroicocephali TaxID=3054939 RepID=A0ABY9L063_9BACI|nr:bifunctional phosphoribosylaminoimidazolecarboxamide formyltransferase/IMP cyclohydrolase [Bacillaceae bacterium 44XB]
MKKQALLSVSDKTGITDFAAGLVKQGFEIISTGGTLKAIEEAGIPVKAVDEVTGFPEIMDGRVKTLHPKVHGGLLAKRDNPEHRQALADNEIDTIDLVAVNLYPFKETLAKPGVSDDEIIENIDIGGPTMLRSAAKNFADVLVVVDPSDYPKVLEALEQDQTDYKLRHGLAAKVFRHTAHYDAMIARYFTEATGEAFPENYTVTYEKVQDLRYGENPHQHAAFYKTPVSAAFSLSSAKQLHGKELSYNNIQDANAALEIVREYAEPAAVAVKHMNPCGVGVGDNIEQAFQRAYDADPVSIFGGIVALNQQVDKATAEILSGIFLEIIIAPGFDQDALDILTQKKNIRLLEMDMVDTEARSHKLTSINGGMLIQDADHAEFKDDQLAVVTKRAPSEEEMKDLIFAWKAVKHVKSNAIVLAKGCQTVGIGAGQMNRVGAAKIAIEQAGEAAEGAALASDAFFPMPDTVEAAAAAGIKAIIQPGGSKRDQESIDACDKHGIAMVLTSMRHFKH